MIFTYWLFGLAFLAVCLGLATPIFIFTSKRDDVPWTDIFLAGPIALFQPERYLKAIRIPMANRLRSLVIVFFTLMLATSFYEMIE
jgi:hypothetical protein